MDLGCGGGIVPGGAQEAQERAPQNAQEARGRAEAGGAGAGKTLLPLLAPVNRAGGGARQLLSQGWCPGGSVSESPTWLLSALLKQKARTPHVPVNPMLTAFERSCSLTTDGRLPSHLP